MIRLFMPLSFMLQVQLQIRMKLTVLMFLLKMILLIRLIHTALARTAYLRLRCKRVTLLLCNSYLYTSTNS